jgi:hypothetical protein
MRCKTLLPLVLAAGLTVAMAPPSARAEDRASPDEAKALAEKAALHMREVGPEKAMADFHQEGGGYLDRDLFVVCYSPEGKVACGIRVPGLLGRDATSFKDADGKEFGKEIMTSASGNGGWVEYRMTNPVTKKVERKASYVIRAGDYIVFVGAYKS